MYKASVRALMRYSIKKLNDGDYALMLKMTHPDFELVFPGQNSWATMFRPQVRGRASYATHRGIEEATAFADRFVGEGLKFQIEDILVNGSRRPATISQTPLGTARRCPTSRRLRGRPCAGTARATRPA